jgi:hypothetical protein
MSRYGSICEDCGPKTGCRPNITPTLEEKAIEFFNQTSSKTWSENELILKQYGYQCSIWNHINLQAFTNWILAGAIDNLTKNLKEKTL